VENADNDGKVILRKVLNVGGSSSLISLPKSWVKKNRIRKGDTLVLQEFPNGDLRISLPGKAHPSREVPEIEIDGMGDRELEAVIIGNYLMGVDYFRIITKLESLTTSQRKVINNALRNLLGFRVVSESPRSLGIKNVLDPSNFNIREEAKRLGILTFFMLKDLVQALKEKNLKAAKEIVVQDEEIDRSYLIMRRLLMIACNNAVVAKRIGIEDTSFCIVWSILLKKIETVADRVVEIVKLLPLVEFERIPGEVFNLFVRIGKHLLALFEGFLKLYYDEDFNGTFELKDLELFEELKSSLTAKEVEHSLNLQTAFALERICFLFEEIAKYVEEQIRDHIHYELYFK